MNAEVIGDISLVILIGYVSIGVMMFLIETLAELEFYNTILYEFTKLDQTSCALMLFMGCVGAWPMIIIFELLTKRKNGRRW